MFGKRPSQISTGSRIARPTISIFCLWNLATLASVSASAITFVRMLWAWRLYNGVIDRLKVGDNTDALLENDVAEAWREVKTSHELELAEGGGTGSTLAE